MSIFYMPVKVYEETNAIQTNTQHRIVFSIGYFFRRLRSGNRSEQFRGTAGRRDNRSP